LKGGFSASALLIAGALFTASTAMQRSKRLGVSASSLDYIRGLALRNDPIGSYNTAVGDGALYHNDHGIENAAIGYAALTNTLPFVARW
jgi:hypothetical protein